MATSLALKRLSSSALVSKLLRPSSVVSGRAFNSDSQLRNHDDGHDVDPRDPAGRFVPASFSGAFHPFSPTRSLSRMMNMKDQGMGSLLFSSCGGMGAMPRRGWSSKHGDEAKVIKGEATAEKEDEAEMFNGVLKTVVKDEEKKETVHGNILRPLSPHLPIYQAQLTSTLSIANRISAVFLTAGIFSFYLVCLNMGPICFTYNSFYQFLFYSSKLTNISLQLGALALSYHVYYGLRHLAAEFSVSFFHRIGRKALK